MIFTKYFDIHSIIHFIGCYGLFFTFIALGSPTWVAICLAAALGFIWEALDELNYIYEWKVRFLDPRGADILDLLTDIAGIFLAYLVYNI